MALKSSNENKNFLHTVPDAIVVLIVCSLVGGSYFCGQFFAHQSDRFNEIALQKTIDSLKTLKPKIQTITKDTCIEKEKKIYMPISNKEESVNNSHNINGNGNNVGVNGDVHINNGAPSELDDVKKQQLLNSIESSAFKLPLENRKNICYVAIPEGDPKAQRFGNEIKEFLINEGYKTIGFCSGVVGDKSRARVSIKVNTDSKCIMIYVNN